MASAMEGPLPRWQRFPSVPLALIGVFLGFVFLPRVRESAGLLQAFLGAGGFLAAWMGILWAGARHWNRSFHVDLVPVARAHYIQGCVQLCIYMYWGTYWPEVFAEMPLIAAQLVFYYILDALISWSRGRAWRLGCGPLPIILSTNVFLWFKDDWYIFQFLLLTTSALGKEFIRWNRNGRSSHIFNPSAFGLAVFSLALIVTGTTDATWAGRIADTLARPPHIYLVIFLLGLVVQYFFHVTLMTVSAVVMLLTLSAAYTALTGTYYFVFSNIPAPVFLGLHLLVTDPATSPRTNAGKILFGASYGLLTFVAYGTLSAIGSYTVYDKLLPIPLLNLTVRFLDRWTREGIVGAFSRWETAFKAPTLNLAHMGIWVAIFSTMLGTGFVGAQHEGGTAEFWRRKVDEGNPYGAQGLVEVLKSQSRAGFAPAWNELGILYLEGKIVAKDPQLAARCFARGVKAGSVAAAANIVTQFLAVEGAKAGPTVSASFDLLERECSEGRARGDLHFLLGVAYHAGKGRPRDLTRSRKHFEAGCALGHPDACEALSRVSPQRTGARAPAR